MWNTIETMCVAYIHVCVFDNEAFNEKYSLKKWNRRIERMSNLIFEQFDVRLLSMVEFNKNRKRMKDCSLKSDSC